MTRPRFTLNGKPITEKTIMDDWLKKITSDLAKRIERKLSDFLSSDELSKVTISFLVDRSNRLLYKIEAQNEVLVKIKDVFGEGIQEQ